MDGLDNHIAVCLVVDSHSESLVVRGVTSIHYDSTAVRHLGAFPSGGYNLLNLSLQFVLLLFGYGLRLLPFLLS